MTDVDALMKLVVEYGGTCADFANRKAAGESFAWLGAKGMEQLTAIRTALSAGGWRAIAEAPRDGLFIGWSVDDHHQIIHGKTYWQSVAPDAKPYMPVQECMQLTHWMPIAPPPTEGEMK
jgi:hypothetical protein